MKKFIKDNIIGFVIGAILFSVPVGVSAYKMASSDIEYDNSTSGLEAETIQDAVDLLAEKADATASTATIKGYFSLGGTYWKYQASTGMAGFSNGGATLVSSFTMVVNLKTGSYTISGNSGNMSLTGRIYMEGGYRTLNVSGTAGVYISSVTYS